MKIYVKTQCTCLYVLHMVVDIWNPRQLTLQWVAAFWLSNNCTIWTQINRFISWDRPYKCVRPCMVYVLQACPLLCAQIPYLGQVPGTNKQRFSIGWQWIIANQVKNGPFMHSDWAQDQLGVAEMVWCKRKSWTVAWDFHHSTHLGLPELRRERVNQNSDSAHA